MLETRTKAPCANFIFLEILRRREAIISAQRPFLCAAPARHYSIMKAMPDVDEAFR